MPVRTFVDSKGREWHVWDVVPHLGERRDGGSDRRGSESDVAHERREQERRLSETHRSVLRGSYSRGWLCFESNDEKRRLTPIPVDWTTCGIQQLEQYARAGEVVSTPQRNAGTAPEKTAARAR